MLFRDPSARQPMAHGSRHSEPLPDQQTHVAIAMCRKYVGRAVPSPAVLVLFRVSSSHEFCPPAWGGCTSARFRSPGHRSGERFVEDGPKSCSRNTPWSTKTVRIAPLGAEPPGGIPATFVAPCAISFEASGVADFCRALCLGVWLGALRRIHRTIQSPRGGPALERSCFHRHDRRGPVD